MVCFTKIARPTVDLEREAFSLFKKIRQTKSKYEMWCMDQLTVDGVDEYLDASEWLGGDMAIQAEVLVRFNNKVTRKSNIDRVCKIIPLDAMVVDPTSRFLTMPMAADLPEAVEPPELPIWFAYGLDEEPLAANFRVAMPVDRKSQAPIRLDESCCILYHNEYDVAVSMDFSNRTYSIMMDGVGEDRTYGGHERYERPLEGTDWREWMVNDAITLLRSAVWLMEERRQCQYLSEVVK